jgi:peptide methionine sulfoxide reductase msrA/msrB
VIKTASLTPAEIAIIKNQKTELPFSGNYNHLKEPGTYLCKQCGLALFRASSKFSSTCGWPSFDENLEGVVRQRVDKDGSRTEIICNRCEAHLGHVFTGEELTKKNLRHCVNSISLDFVPNQEVKDTEEAIFAAGCFWGVDYFFKKLPGVLKTEVGYSGGKQEKPTYNEVCEGNTGHFEAIRILYDPTQVTFRDLAKYFFEIHDPTQADGQGPDRGEQYKSVAFYYDDQQKKFYKN